MSDATTDDVEWLAWIATTLYAPENRERCKRIAEDFAATRTALHKLADAVDRERGDVPVDWDRINAAVDAARALCVSEAPAKDAT